jgi:hypothetical protein
MKYALLAATALLLATPAFAQDAETLAQTPVYQSVPAHQAVIDNAIANLPGGDAELLSRVTPATVPAHQADTHQAANRIPGGDAELLSAGYGSAVTSVQ